MNAVPAELLKAALALPAEAREQLLSELAASLEEDGADVDDETAGELLRRIASVEAGNVVDAREGMARIRQKRA